MTRRAVCALLAFALALPAAVAGGQGSVVAGVVTVPNATVTDIVVYLVPTAAPRATAVTPSSAKMDQRDLRFVPRVVAVTPGSTVMFSNSDRVMHNVFHPWQSNEGFDLGLWAPGESRQFTFEKEGAFVMMCQVHPEMVGYVVVVGSSYRGVTDEHGRFHIEGVPSGVYLLRTWHHRLAAHEERVTVPEGGLVQLDVMVSLGKAEAPSSKR